MHIILVYIYFYTTIEHVKRLDVPKQAGNSLETATFHDKQNTHFLKLSLQPSETDSS